MSMVRKVLVGALLLVAVTAGSATAGVLIGSAGIKDNTVGGVDIRDGSLAGVDVRDGSLQLTDIAGLEEGAKGVQGPPGQPGTNGVPGLQYRQLPRTLQATQLLTLTAECQPDEESIAGGISSTAPGLVTIRRSFPDGDHWSVEVKNGSTAAVNVFVWAVCIPD